MNGYLQHLKRAGLVEDGGIVVKVIRVEQRVL
jgi:hypothetical protein